MYQKKTPYSPKLNKNQCLLIFKAKAQFLDTFHNSYSHEVIATRRSSQAVKGQESKSTGEIVLKFSYSHYINAISTRWTRPSKTELDVTQLHFILLSMKNIMISLDTTCNYL